MLDWIPEGVQVFCVLFSRMLLSVVVGAAMTKLVQCELFGDSVFFSHNRFRNLIRGWHLGEHENGALSKTPEQIGQAQADARLAQALATKSIANALIFMPITILFFLAMSMR